jgi:TetR/AcrR family transcriptional regulator, transcriptional repressor of bet genes
MRCKKRTFPENFQRLACLERQNSIIDASIVALAKHGAAGISVRTIANQAGVSPSLITYHFGTINDLLAETATRIGENILRALNQDIDDAGCDCRQRLAAFVSGCFRNPAIVAGAGGGWTGVIGLAQSILAVNKAYRAVLDSLKDRVCVLLAACDPFQEHRMIAAGLAAMIGGFWTEMSCNVGSVSLGEAERLSLDWLRCLGMLQSKPSDAQIMQFAHDFA